MVTLEEADGFKSEHPRSKNLPKLSAQLFPRSRVNNASYSVDMGDQVGIFK